MKLTSLIILLLLATTPAVFAAGAGQNLLLFYSNDVHGETKPCG